MKTKMTGEEAIRQVILEGVGGDFCDVAKVVGDRFRLDVSASEVEEIYGQIREELTKLPTVASEPQPDEKLPVKISSVAVSMQSKIPKPKMSASAQAPPSAAADQPGRDPVLAFVESMGGFDAAREAITNLEVSVKQLLK
jgi:hypothetical protein